MMKLSKDFDSEQENAIKSPIFNGKTEEIQGKNQENHENHEKNAEIEGKKGEIVEKMAEIEGNEKENREIKSSVFSCLSIKRLVMHLSKFTSPILKKNKENNDLSQKTQEKLSFFQEKEAFFQEENAVFVEKDTNFQEKDHNFMQKTEEKEVFSENIAIIMKTEENKPKKSKQRSVFLKRNLPEVSSFQKYEFFMKMMNFSNNLTSPISKNQANYKVFLGKGNNRTLIKTLMKNR